MHSSEIEEKNDRSGIQVISRAAAILRVLKDDQSGLSLGQIAARADLARSTVQRITGALAQEGLVIHDPNGRGLRLGPELASLAEAAKLDVVERCRMILNELSRETGETTDLAACRGGAMVFLDQVPGLHRLRTVSSVGDVFPLTTTANGRACLALMPREESLAIIEAELARTGKPIDVDELLALLEKIRADGLAYDIDEHTIGISAIGFAFEDVSGQLYAISVPVPSSRFEASRKKVAVALRHAKTRVETELNLSRGFVRGTTLEAG